jgi:hypothetical protein
MMANANDSAESKERRAIKHKVVITMQDGILAKGYYCAGTPVDLNSLAGNSEAHLRERYTSENGTQLEIDWSQVKAVFFVSSFEGDRKYEPLRFYVNGPAIKSIWVEIVFRDGEVIEGCVQNSLDHLRNDGFFLLPSTPGGNNLLIYVNKAAIADYRVLGVS